MSFLVALFCKNIVSMTVRLDNGRVVNYNSYNNKSFYNGPQLRQLSPELR